MMLFTKENFNVKYLVNFFFILLLFVLLPNFGFNDFNQKIFFLTLWLIYFLTLVIKAKNIFLIINLLLTVVLTNLGLLDFSYLFIQIFFLSIHPDFTEKYFKIKLFNNSNIYNKVAKLFPPGVLMLLTLLTQNAYLNFEVIDHDVSTSIVIANDIFKGFLPYENSWDDKQPLFYFFNFIFLLLVEKNYVLYKVLFDLFIFLNAYLIFSIVCKQYKQETYKGLLSSITYIFILSQPWSNAEYSEIMSSTFLGLSFYIFLNEEFKKVNYFFAGLFFGVSTLINIGSGIFIFGFILLIFIFFKPNLYQRIGYFTSGLFCIHALVLLVYVLNGLVEIYLTTLIKIPLTYTSTDTYFFYDFRVFVEEIFTTNIFLFTMALILLFSIMNVITDNKRLFFISFQTSSFLIFMTLSLLFYYLAGKGFYHHLIYFVFFLSLAIIFINWSNLLLIFSFSFVMTLATYNINLFKSSFTNLSNTEKIYENYPLRQISEEIESKFIDEFSVLSLDQVLILFYLDRSNEVYIIHPTNHTEYFILDNLIQGKFIKEGYLEDSLNSNPNLLVCSTNDKGELFYSIESINYFLCNENDLTSYTIYKYEQKFLKDGEYYRNQEKNTNFFLYP